MTRLQQLGGLPLLLGVAAFLVLLCSPWPAAALQPVTCPTRSTFTASDLVSFLIQTSHTDVTINTFHNCDSAANCAAKNCIAPYTQCEVCDTASVSTVDPYILVTVPKTEAATLTLVAGDAKCTLTVDPSKAVANTELVFGSDCQPISCSAHSSCGRCVMQSGCSWCAAQSTCMSSTQASTCSGTGERFLAQVLSIVMRQTGQRCSSLYCVKPLCRHALLRVSVPQVSCLFSFRYFVHCIIVR